MGSGQKSVQERDRSVVSVQISTLGYKTVYELQMPNRRIGLTMGVNAQADAHVGYHTAGIDLLHAGNQYRPHPPDLTGHSGVENWQERNVSSTCSRHHELDKDGIGWCSVPMWSGFGGDAGFCDKEAYGNRPDGEAITRWDGYRYRKDGLYAGYVPGLACPRHGGPKVRTFMDGDAWCAVRPDFVNLQESPAGFGDTREASIAALAVAK